LGRNDLLIRTFLNSLINELNAILSPEVINLAE